MKEVVTYEKSFLKTPYLQRFLKKYNTSFTNSFALKERLIKNKIVNLEKNIIKVFFDPKIILASTVQTQIKKIESEILSEVLELFDSSIIKEVPENQLLLNKD